jgi:hypothetical protein
MIHPIRFPQRPEEKHPELAGLRTDLVDLLPRHVTVGQLLASSDMYPPDLLMWAFLQRSYSVLDGFLATFDAWNVLVSGPLVRMQIDSLTRLSYVATCPDMDAVATEMLGGGEFRKMHDSSGKALTDRRLVELAGERHAWLKPVYERASGWVHFSPTHVFLGTQAEEGKFVQRLPLNPDTLDETLLAEMLGAMRQATGELLKYLELWGEHKQSIAAGNEAPTDG